MSAQGILAAPLDAAYWLTVSAVCALVVIGLMLLRRGRPERLGTLAAALFLVFLAGSVLLLGAHGFDAGAPQYSGFAPALFGLFFYFYADRRYLSGRGRWLGLLYIATITGQLVNPHTDSAPWPPALPLVSHLLGLMGDALSLLILCSALIPQVYGRIRRPLPPRERAGMPWRMLAGCAVGGGYLWLLTAAAISPVDATSPLPPVPVQVLRAGALVVLALLPVSVAFALARGHRYDRAALIRRGAIFGTQIVALAAVYVASFIALHLVLPLPATFEQDLAPPFLILIALLLIAVYWPMAPWVQKTLDQRFFRHEHAAGETLTAFRAALQEPMALEDLCEMLAATIRRAVAPEVVMLWTHVSAGEAIRISARGSAVSTTERSLARLLDGRDGGAADTIYLLQLLCRPEDWETATTAPGAMALAIAPDDPLGRVLAPEVGPVALNELPSTSAARNTLQAAGTSVAVPLVRPSGAVGLLGMGRREDGAGYSFDDAEFLDAFAALAAPALHEARTRHVQETEERERERVDQELRTAQRIQQALLPKETPRLDGWRVATFYQPAREVGGDFYDFLLLSDGRLGLVIGDVSGKGIPAALVMATTRSMLRAVAETAQQANPPGAVLRRVNELLCGDLPGGMFVTCFYGVLDPASGTMRFANAGQDLPSLRQRDGRVRELRATGMPLGLMPESEYEEREACIEAGASVLLYSDGLVEAHNLRREMFGFARLARFMGGDSGDSATIPALLRDLETFTGGTWEQEDDITLVTLQREPGVAGSVAAGAARAVAAE